MQALCSVQLGGSRRLDTPVRLTERHTDRHTHTKTAPTQTNRSTDKLMDAAVQVVATCKHYAAYSLEAADGWTRQSFDAQVDQRCGASRLAGVHKHRCQLQLPMHV